MSYSLFYTLLSTRLIAPPIIFYYVHPFYAMILDEVVIDGLIAPHHLFKPFVPTEMDTYRKPHYDLPLDAWGFLIGYNQLCVKNINILMFLKGTNRL